LDQDFKNIITHFRLRISSMFRALHIWRIIFSHVQRELGSRLSIPSRGTRRLLCSYTLLPEQPFGLTSPFSSSITGKWGARAKCRATFPRFPALMTPSSDSSEARLINVFCKSIIKGWRDDRCIIKSCTIKNVCVCSRM